MSSETMAPTVERRLSSGVEMRPDGTASVRVWAPACRRVEFTIDGGASYALTRGDDGVFIGSIAGVQPGARYWYRLDGTDLRPDPASRFQPDGPHGPSEIVDPLAFRWTDDGWKGIQPTGQVLYEMHVGTFTPAGAWASAMAELPALADLGVTVIEMMPIADFAGRFGWGYDGVNLYAPSHLYGRPDDLRAFVDRAHAVGLGVILDVVYNHLGPDGNHLSEFSPEYFTDRYTNDWGRAINFEGPPQARAFFVENAGYWIDEFHLDGLRLDATQDIKDASSEHVLASIVRRARSAARGRSIYIIAENEPQDVRLVRSPETGGFGFDALWDDDYHHTTTVALTGRREAYYTDYTGSAQELISCAKYGYLYQGQWYRWQKKRRGTSSLDVPSHMFVAYMENHDQVANSAFGRRLHQLSSPQRYRALTALTLLGPATPLLFQGQEFASTAPFLYFADHRKELRGPVREGRREFLSQFKSLSDPEIASALPSPVDPATFERCKLDLSERRTHAAVYALHRDLLEVRRNTPAIAHARKVDGAVIGPHALVIRFFHDDECLLIVNLQSDFDLSPAPEPLLAPPSGRRWSCLWSSEAVRYGGQGTPPLDADAEWHIPGGAAVLFSSVLSKPDDDAG
jgi:maltooligosyltrehalose trehalohydrolase